MKPPRTLKEALLALSLLAFGLICLPGLIFYVGQLVVGEYETGILGLYEATGSALAGGDPFAWFLVLSPYLIVQLWRISLWLRRQRRAVN